MSQYLKTIIIDDELDGRLILSSLLTDHCESVKILGSFESAEAGMKAIQALKPDLVLLDIEMPDMNAFTLLEQLAVISFEVIFVTAYDHYALKAIKHNALEYILKPVDKEELTAAVDKCIKKLNLVERQEVVKIGGFSKIILSVRDGYIFVDIDRIIRCEGDGNYTNLYLDNNEKHIASRTLKEFEQLLPASTFIRIHKSHLINANYIKKYVRSEGGTVVMSDNSELEVSRRNKDHFLKFFNLQ